LFIIIITIIPLIKLQTSSFIEIRVFYDAQFFIVKNENIVVMCYSYVLEHEIFVQCKPPPVGVLQQKHFGQLTGGVIIH